MQTSERLVSAYHVALLLGALSACSSGVPAPSDQSASHAVPECPAQPTGVEFVPACPEGPPGGRPPGLPAPDWPNEPAGFSVITDQPWTLRSDDTASRGWVRLWGVTKIVHDATARFSPTSVLEIEYPSGFGGGEAPGTEAILLPGVRQVYVGIWWKPSDPWQGHNSNTNKIQYVFTRNRGSMFMAMYGPPGGPFHLRVYPQFSSSNGTWLVPNVAQKSVALGLWHRIEWLIVYNTTHDVPNGIVRWWLDGELVGDYGDIAFPDEPMSEYKLSPVWGGVGDAKAHRDWFRYDHIRISGR